MFPHWRNPVLPSPGRQQRRATSVHGNAGVSGWAAHAQSRSGWPPAARQVSIRHQTAGRRKRRDADRWRGPVVEISVSAKLKRAGAKPTLFVDQDKGTARDFVESPGCACTDVLRSSAAGHYFLAFFFAFFAMVISPAVPIIGGSELLDKADELYVT
jgi:hypothetical protein